MCTLNGAGFLPLQIESILAQTVLPAEVVVCDDGSTDTTFGVLEMFQRSAPFPVRLFRNEETLGAAQNFAKCIALCTCEIVVLTDQDDVWFPERLAMTVAALEREPTAAGSLAREVALVYSDAPLIGAAGEDLGSTMYARLPLRSGDRRRLERGGHLLPVLARYSVLCGATMAFPAHLRPLLLPVPAGWMHDEWIGLVCSALGQVARLPRPAMRYRQHASQLLGVGGRWTVAVHRRVARGRDEAFYRRELARFGTAIEILKQKTSSDGRTHATSAPGVATAPAQFMTPLMETLLQLLAGKQAFFRDRLIVQGGGWQGLVHWGKLITTGRYVRYSSGLRSAVKDFAVLLQQLVRSRDARS